MNVTKTHTIEIDEDVILIDTEVRADHNFLGNYKMEVDMTERNWENRFAYRFKGKRSKPGENSQGNNGKSSHTDKVKVICYYRFDLLYTSPKSSVSTSNFSIRWLIDSKIITLEGQPLSLTIEC